MAGGAQHCGTEEVIHRYLEGRPELEQEMARQEAFIQEFTDRLVDFRGDGADPLYVIPVVFHVIHSGGSENIPRERILAALQRLNEDFNRRNADAGEAPASFRVLAADVRVEFRLAALDPEGQCTDGIVRVYSPVFPRRESEILALSRWPVDRYLNVWITASAVDESGNAYGAYARYPQGDDDGNGIFMSARFLADPYFLAVESDLLTHETGHFLNLAHIWGNTNLFDPGNGCELDDSVEDTPRQRSANTGCPAFPRISCEGEPNGDNYSNFMDYSSCRNMFTRGQRDRMWAALNSALAGRNRLWSPENLAAAGLIDPDSQPFCSRPPKVDFGWGQYYDVYCPGQPIAFHATATGSSVDRWAWTFEGGTPRSSAAPAPRVYFDGPGDYRITLIAGNDYGRDTVSRIIRLPFLSERILYPIVAAAENFEDENRFREYTIFDSFRDGSWELADGTSRGDGMHSLQLVNPTFPASAIPVANSSDGFFTPFFDLENAGGGSLSFHIAYNNLLASEDGRTALRISAYAGCDLADPLRVATLSAGEIATPEYVFPPLPEAFWKKVTLPLPAAAGWQRIRFFFELIHRRGEVPNIYIDDITFEPSGLTSVAEPAGSTWRLAPNPATSTVRVSLPESLPLPAYLSIVDVTGRRVRTIRLQSTEPVIDIRSLAGGMYFLELRAGKDRSMRRLVVTNP